MFRHAQNSSLHVVRSRKSWTVCSDACCNATHIPVDLSIEPIGPSALHYLSCNGARKGLLQSACAGSGRTVESCR
jgi:hypothetical protein